MACVNFHSQMYVVNFIKGNLFVEILLCSITSHDISKPAKGLS